MAQFIRANGEILEAEPKNGTSFELDELQAFVGGWIEIVNTYDGRLMVLDEEGKLKGKSVNEYASQLFGWRDVIVGDVLVCDVGQID